MVRENPGLIWTQKDRDLLVTLNVKVDGIVTDIKELKDGLTDRITVLENKVQALEESHAGFNVQEVVQDFRIWKDRLKLISWLIAPVYLTIAGLILDRIF